VVEQMKFVRGYGCTNCSHTGYRGRIGVFEMIEIDAGLADALRREDVETFVRLAEQQPGYSSLARSALDFAAEGVTSLDEVLRLAGEDEEEVPLPGDAVAGEDAPQDADEVAG
jgi:MSHA biogenesis protein MshE